MTSGEKYAQLVGRANRAKVRRMLAFDRAAQAHNRLAEAEEVESRANIALQEFKEKWKQEPD